MLVGGADALVVWRCPNCSRILARLKLGTGSEIEIKCASCGRFSIREVPLPDASATLG
jgi:phage FluMu protein Com